MNKKSLRRDMPERLVKFLKKRKLLTKFLNNIVNGIKGCTTKQIDLYSEVDVMLRIQQNNAISVFAWHNTPERETFWVNIFFKYRDEYDNDSNRV